MTKNQIIEYERLKEELRKAKEKLEKLNKMHTVALKYNPQCLRDLVIYDDEGENSEKISLSGYEFTRLFDLWLKKIKDEIVETELEIEDL